MNHLKVLRNRRSSPYVLAPGGQLRPAPLAVNPAPQAPAPDLAERIDEAMRAAKKGRATKACSVFDQVARAAGVPLTLDQPVVLAVHQPWFDVAPADLTRELVGLGYTPCWFDPAEALPAEPGHEDADIDLRSARHRDVALWEVTAYDFCVRHELSLAEAEASLEDRAEDLRREYARARALIDRAHRNFDVYAPECALIAQGHVMASAVVRAVALARGVRVVAIENTFHSERLLWDDDAALPVVSSRAKSVWLRDKSQVTDAQAEAYVDDFLGRAKDLKSAQHASPSAGSPWAAVEQQLGVDAAADPRRRRIVLLGQVATDAAVLFGLRSGFTRQLDVIRTVAEYAEREGHTLVIKLHPKEDTGASPLGIPYQRLSERQMKADPALAALMERDAFVLDADNALDTDQLSAGADACVAVNSQAGLEALVRGSEVVLCGNAFYGGLGFTHEAEDPGSLEVALTRALDGDGRRNAGAEAKRFFVTYLEGLCLPKTVGTMGALCATPRTEPASARPAPNAASAYIAPSREEREAYGSGERQTAVQFESIRADHRVRYDFAAEWLTAELARARRGDGPLLGIDAFCGNGYGAARLARASHVCVQGIDASEDAIAVAQQHFGNERVQFEARRFPFDLPKERFDFATCFESIEHVEEDGALLETLARSLAPGGLLFVSVPNEETLPIAHNAAFFKFHVRHYRTEQLVELAASKGLALRAKTGQYAYRTSGLRAVKPLPEDRMGLDPAIPDPHFVVLAFQKITPESVAASGPADALRLDLGCGESGPKPGFEGVDIRPLPGIKHVTDMFALDERFTPDSVQQLYSRHAFEHLSFEDGERAMECWARVLAPGGSLHMLIPDIRYHIAQFLEEDPTAPSAANPAWTVHEHALAGFWGWQRETGTVWDVHKSGYDFAMLRALLLRHGFEDVVRVDGDPWHLNVVATRPRK